MASVVMADDSIAFDGLMAETAALGGAETAFAALAEALAIGQHADLVNDPAKCQRDHRMSRFMVRGHLVVRLLLHTSTLHVQSGPSK